MKELWESLSLSRSMDGNWLLSECQLAITGENMREETAIENTKSESCYVLEENGALSLDKCLGAVQNVRTRILVNFRPGTRPVLASSF